MAIFVILAVFFVMVFVLALDDGDAAAPIINACFAILCGARVWTATRLARNLSSGPGRFVFIVEHVAAGRSSRRLLNVTFTKQRGKGRWVHLVDAGDATDLGWAEVGRINALWLRGEDVGALWGDPSSSGLSLSGPFPTTQVYGRLRSERPVHRSHWDPY